MLCVPRDRYLVLFSQVPLGSHGTLGWVVPRTGQGSLKQDKKYVVLRGRAQQSRDDAHHTPHPTLHTRFFDRVVTDSEVRNTDLYLALLSLFAKIPDFVA